MFFLNSLYRFVYINRTFRQRNIFPCECTDFSQTDSGIHTYENSKIPVCKMPGKKIYTTEVYANRIEFAGAKMVDRTPFPEDAEGFLEIPESMEEEMPFR